MQNVEKSRFPWWIVIAAIAVLALLAGALILFFVLRGNNDNVNVNINVNKPNSAVKANKTKAKADAPTPAPTPSFEGTWVRQDEDKDDEDTCKEIVIQRDGDVYTVSLFSDNEADDIGPFPAKVTPAGILEAEGQKDEAKFKFSLKLTGSDKLTIRLEATGKNAAGEKENVALRQVLVRK